MDPIILASASPRRQDFFRLMGIPFTCIPAMIDETPPPGLTPQQAAEDLALRKALAVAESGEWGVGSREWIFAADTIVVLDDEIFGKPADRDDARRMLERLSGRWHEVITAMALYNGRLKTTDCRSKTSEVAFAPLTGAEIEWKKKCVFILPAWAWERQTPTSSTLWASVPRKKRS